ncbi:monovalent cation/H+ antiporter subunit E [Corynebacterium hadale]|uniref:monovalent cation/H+ antiporter subunit E n=1 Tax=Corynebacterium hadale TaxID=2026255 RepID=UPI000BAA3CF8|nr:monovalent cation/H+ antiporter subunit E [Corynebacterium hadale]PAT11025.1 sodium:proton antiporter [Corynebacterium hadale]
MAQRSALNSIGHAIGYGAWLIKEIYVAGIDATIAAFKPDTGMHPCVVFYPMRVSTDWERFWFSTSITATPGTLSLGFRHAASEEGRDLLIVQAAFGDDPHQVIEDLADMEERLKPELKDTPIDASKVLWKPYEHLGPDRDHEYAEQLPAAERMD